MEMKDQTPCTHTHVTTHTVTVTQPYTQSLSFTHTCTHMPLHTCTVTQHTHTHAQTGCCIMHSVTIHISLVTLLSIFLSICSSIDSLSIYLYFYACALYYFIFLLFYFLICPSPLSASYLCFSVFFCFYFFHRFIRHVYTRLAHHIDQKGIESIKTYSK